MTFDRSSEETGTAASARDRQTLPDALVIGERVRRATLAAAALHLIEVRRGATGSKGTTNDARRTGGAESAA